MLKTASKPVDVQDLQFKLQCRLTIFDKKEGVLTKTPKALLASASRYGLVFVGCSSSKLKVFRFENIEESLSTEATTNYLRREVNLISQPHYICVNCDHTILGVVLEKDSCLTVLFYDILSFYKENIVLLNEVKLTNTSGLNIVQANWHPTINNIFTEIKSDGTLGIYELKDKSFDVKKLPAESKASCFCWSPKGKQIAVGSQDGKIIHYKPDLKAVKSIDAPPFDKPHSVLSLQWISNYQFVGVFKTCQELDPECSVVVIDSPKTGNPVFTNFYDICYSNGEARPPQFYLIAEQQWNILLVGSANSMEIGVLSSTGEIWTQCILPDSARAELPLDKNQDETFPVGMTVDNSSVKPVLWGESYIQPCPSLLLLSTEGVLCCFRIINLKDNVPNINSPPEKINDMSGVKYFVAQPSEATQVFTAQQSSQVDKTPTNLHNQANSTPTSSMFSAAHSNSPSMFPLANSTLVATPPGTQRPTTPLSIFKAPTPKATLPPQPTVLFGGQVSITPVKKKEETLQTPTASIGNMLLSGINNKGIEEKKENRLPFETGPAEAISFTNFSAGPASAETKSNTLGKTKNAEEQSSTGSTLKNLLSGNSLMKTSNNPITSSLPPSSFGRTQVPIGIPPVTSSQNVSVGAQKLGEKPNVPSSVSNASQSQNYNKVQRNLKEEENSDIKNMMTKILQMECAALDKEIRELIIQGQHLRINLDSKEMDKIVHLTESISEFLKELVETCEIQTSEVHILKQNTIQSWAWLEEARSRYKESKDEELKNVLKSKPLDSVSEKHLSTLKQMQYYLNSQLTQSHKALDEQWDKFQDYCRKTSRVQLPTMEAIFQTMVKQNAVLQKHNYILKDITSQIKGKQKASNHAALFNPSDKNDNLESCFRNLKLEPESIYHIYYQKILNRVKSLPTDKTNQLRRILHNREVPHVTVKSHLSTSVSNLSSRLNQQIDISVRTPNRKKAEKSEFFQSSPLNVSSEPLPQISSTPMTQFSSMNNINSNEKPELSFRLLTESQKSLPISKTNKENVSVEKPITSANPTFSVDKQSPFSNQNSLFKTPTMNMNVSVSSNSSVNQEPNQNVFRSNINSTASFPFSNSLETSTSKTSNKPSPLISSTSSFNSNVISATSQNSKTSNIFGQPSNSSSTFQGGGPSLNLFSFAPSSTPSNQFINSANVTSPSAVIAGISSHSTKLLPTTVSNNDGSIPHTTAASSTFSFMRTKSNTISTTDNTSSSAITNNDSVASTQNLFSKNTGLSAFASDVKTEAALPSEATSAFGFLNKNIGVVPKCISFGTGSETTSTAAATSIFGSGTNKSGDSANSKFSFVNTETKTSLPSAFSVSSIVGTSSTSGSAVPTTNTSIIQSAKTSGESRLPQTTLSHFGNVEPSPESAHTPATSIFSSSSNKEQPSTSSSLFPTNSGSPFAVQSGFSFGNSGGSLFGTPTSNEPTSSIINKNSTSIFGSITTVSSVTTTTTSISSPSITTKGPVTDPLSTPLSSSKSGSATTKSLFSSEQNIGQVPSATTGNSGSYDSVQTASNPLFNTPSSSHGVMPVSTHSIFGNGMVQTTPKSIFGASKSSDSGVSTSSASIFGASVTNDGALPLTKSIFRNDPKESESILKTKTPAISSQSNFGSSTGSSLFANSSFGASNAPSTGSIFGNTASTTEPSNNSAKSLFGSSSATVTQSQLTSSLFGGTTSSNSVFGQANSGSPFNTATANSPFSSAVTNEESPFGAKPGSSNSLFGSVAPSVCSPFGSTPTFGAQSSPFGQVSTASNAFGSNVTNSTFVTSTENSSSPFVQNSAVGTQSAGMFGTFGTSSENNNAKGSFGFGSLTMGSDQPNSFAKTNETKSPFGGTSFNPTASAGSIFGASTFGNNNGNSVFGKSAFGNNAPFSSAQQIGSFSGGSGSIAQTGFGVSQDSPKPSAFGGAPSYGGTPAFGAAPTFGGAPAFGSTASFGSPSKIFGLPNPSSTGTIFGSNNQPSGFGGFGNQNSLGFGSLAQQPNNQGENAKQTSGFGSFATQNTIGFGNLAQQNNTGQNAPFSGNSSFSSWR
ncbi:nuclear pore complex protein Nup214 [Harmonia axyridis]|uniref:nuclear pore complex protein Nup214 n=1 Tax=Harmonia axyridis TaxID=115357 RepID=UPI001E27975A|nr:nuclear pore complex protein Nup214 [Harmonia axyridis]